MVFEILGIMVQGVFILLVRFYVCVCVYMCVNLS